MDKSRNWTVDVGQFGVHGLEHFVELIDIYRRGNPCSCHIVPPFFTLNYQSCREIDVCIHPRCNLGVNALEGHSEDCGGVAPSKI